MMHLLPVLFLTFFLSVCGGAPPAGEPVEITIPSGATFREVVDTLESRGLVGSPLFFRIYARLRDSDTQVRSGSYAIRSGAKWSTILRDLTEGRVVTMAMTIPEGFTVPLSITVRLQFEGREDPDVFNFNFDRLSR